METNYMGIALTLLGISLGMIYAGRAWKEGAITKKIGESAEWTGIIFGILTIIWGLVSVIINWSKCDWYGLIFIIGMMVAWAVTTCITGKRT
jgi:vacuolar-type H+-ATPase subunit I/STV1